MPNNTKAERELKIAAAKEKRMHARKLRLRAAKRKREAAIELRNQRRQITVQLPSSSEPPPNLAPTVSFTDQILAMRAAARNPAPPSPPAVVEPTRTIVPRPVVTIERFFSPMGH